MASQKQKTHRGAAKRFSLTGTGKLKRGKAGARHILSNKNRKRKRRLGEAAYVDKADAKRIKRMLPNHL